MKKIIEKPEFVILEKTYKIPKFESIDANGNKITEQNIIGSWCILYFYPKDMTSGCTLQAKEFELAKKEFSALNCKILGVSKDSCSTHIKFAQKESISFTLISDKESNVCEAFDVWKEKSMYGKKYMGIERTTFIINPDGMICAIFKKVKVTGHVKKVLHLLKNLMKIS